MNDSDLEDIESHLYSQVYHSNEEFQEHPHALPLDNLQETAPTMKKPNRYFQSDKRSLGFRFQNREQSNLKPNVPNYNQTQGFYSKDYARPHKRDNNISIRQLVVLSTPQQPPFVCVTNPVRQKQKLKRDKWKAKVKERKRQRAAAKLLNCQQKNIEKSNEVTDIITLSDSDDDSCVVVANELPVLSVLDSDEENKDDQGKIESEDKSLIKLNVSTDDVIFVENSPVEIINVDEVDCSQKNSDEVIAHGDVETASLASSNNSFINNNFYASPSKTVSAKTINQERKELLSTPDSASNDFINNCGVDLQKDKFNFSLHGTGFDSHEFVKPANPTETESSSSTTDNNTLNSMKTSVFNEIEFPKDDIFSENNLESFGNFITPLRKRADKKFTQSSTPVKNIVQVQSPNLYSSDSSSESDFDDASSDNSKLLKKYRNLPDLSPMQSDNESTTKSNNLLPAVKKPRKVINMCSKYDLVNPISSDVTPKNNKKKRKSIQLSDILSTNSEANTSKKKIKNKKRKSESPDSKHNNTAENFAIIDSNINENLENSSANSNNNTEIEQDVKQKRKKSVQISEEAVEASEINSYKKKLKGKKKKSSDAELDDKSNATESADYEQENHQISEGVVSITVNTNSEGPLLDETLSKAQKETEQPEELLITSCTENRESNQVAQEEISCSLDIKPEKTQDEINNSVITNSESIVPSEITTEEKEDEVEGLVVVDEVFTSENEIEVLVSDPESILSGLKDPGDIQLINCKEPQNFNDNTDDSRHLIETRDLTQSSVEELQHSMSNDPKLWAILDSDRMPQIKDNMIKRCNKCREKGHMALRCPNKVVPKCRLCGDLGHYEPRCPNRICTQCGERSPYSTTYCRSCFQYRNHQCEVCSMVGHPSKACPDLWRRYHLTTAEGPLKTCEGPLLKPKHKLWCSGCARSGHLEYSCRFYQSVYPPSDPCIKSYEDVYNIRSGIGSAQSGGRVGPSLYYGVNNYVDTYQSQNQQVQNYQMNYNLNNYIMNPFSNNSAFMYPSSGYGLNHDSRYSEGYQQFRFEDNLPNFISFETPTPQNSNLRQVNPCGRYFSGEQVNNVTVAAPERAVENRPQKQFKVNGAVFFSSPVQNVHQFVSNELQKLMRMSYQVNNIVKHLKRQKIESGNRSQINEYNKTLNMVLFGIYKLKDGEQHLVRLKTFKQVKQWKAKLGQKRRENLYKSYCYIFGVDKHAGIDYNELLRQI